MKEIDYKITAVIPFCSYDKPFFKPCIENLLALGIECIVVSCTNLYAGEIEDLKTLHECHDLFKDNPNFKHTTMWWHTGETSLYWEAMGRYIGTLYANPKINIFFTLILMKLLM